MKITSIIGCIMITTLLLLSNQVKSQSDDRWIYVTTEKNYKIKIFYDVKSLKYYSKQESNNEFTINYVSVWVKYKYNEPTKIFAESSDVITEYLERIEIDLTRKRYEITSDYLCYNKDKSFTYDNYGYMIFGQTYYLTPLTVYEKIYFMLLK